MLSALLERFCEKYEKNKPGAIPVNVKLLLTPRQSRGFSRAVIVPAVRVPVCRSSPVAPPGAAALGRSSWVYRRIEELLKNHLGTCVIAGAILALVPERLVQF